MRKLRRLAGGRLLPCILSAFFVALALALSAIFLPKLLAPVSLAGSLLSIAAALAVTASDMPEEYKLSWLVLILALPWMGAVLALLWKSPARPENALSRCGQSRWERVASLCCGNGNFPAYANSVRYFSVGKEMRDSLLSDLAAAKRTVCLEYYIVEHGVFFSDMLRVLSARAAEGVKVRLLYDDFGCSLTLPHDFIQTLSAFGIEARPFRKLKPTRAAGRRDHRKLAVIDGAVAYTGGVNLADEYIGARIRFGHWKDTAVRIEGGPAARFEALFFAHWEKSRPKNAPPETQIAGEISQNRTNAAEIPCAVLADDADGGARIGGKVLSLLALSAERTLYLTTPYLAPDAITLSALKTAAGGGVDVRLMIPHIPDKKLPFLLTRSYARELVRAGVQVREYTAGFLHAKNLVSDGEYLLVSSYNLDFRSLWMQAECGACVKDADAAGRAERDFLADWETGTPVKAANPMERASGAVLRLLAPLL